MGKFFIVAFACVCCAVVVSSAVPAPLSGLEDADGSALVYLTPEQVTACKMQGGCQIFTHDQMLEMVEEAAAKWRCSGNTKVEL